MEWLRWWRSEAAPAGGRQATAASWALLWLLRTSKEAVRAKGRLSGDLSTLLEGMLAVDAWRAGPMPAYGRQMGRAAITGHHTADSACGRSAIEAIDSVDSVARGAA